MAKKKHPVRRLFTLSLLASLVGAGWFRFKQSTPTEDPWSEAYWEDVNSAKAS